MAVNAMEFFPKVDRTAPRSAAPDAPVGQQAKKGAKGAAANDFASALDSARDRREVGDRSEKEPIEADVRTRRDERDQARPLTKRASRSKVDETRERMGVDRGAERPEASADVPMRDKIRAESAREPIASGAINREAPKTKSETTPAEAMDAVVERKNILRQRAVLDFMTEMKDRFGVEPDEIVSAFAQLDADTLQGRPEDAMAGFLAALQLPPQQLKEAANLYQKMVQDTGEGALNEQLAGQDKSVSFQLMGASDYKKMRLHESLDAMTERFFPRPMSLVESKFGREPAWMNDGSLMKSTQPQGDLASMLQGLDKNAVLDSAADQTSQGMASSANPDMKTDANAEARRGAAGDKSLGALGLLAGALGGAAASGATVSAKSSGNIADSVGDATDSMNTLTSALQSSLGGDARPMMSDGLGADGGLANGDGGSQSPASFSAPGQNAMSMMGDSSAFAAAAGAYAAKQDSRQTESEPTLGEGDAQAAMAAGAATVGGQQRTDSAQPLNPEAMMVRQPGMTSEQQQENIQELIRNAQVIMRKGGGEMKMQLKPEGIGQVDLRVLVQDGQVNVQMITENDGAKKMLENGLNELKAQLAAHKLHVETLKVDIADGGLRKFDQHTQSDAQREQARQFASDFMGQFREDRQAFRQGFFDRPGMRNYDESRRRGANMEPAPVEASSASGTARAKERSNGSRRLNLVA